MASDEDEGDKDEERISEDEENEDEMMSKVAHLFTLIHTVVRKPRFGLAHI
jgi:hypothetical protein